MLCYAMLRYAMLCCAMLSYFFLFYFTGDLAFAVRCACQTAPVFLLAAPTSGDLGSGLRCPYCEAKRLCVPRCPYCEATVAPLACVSLAAPAVRPLACVALAVSCGELRARGVDQKQNTSTPSVRKKPYRSFEKRCDLSGQNMC